MLQQGENCPACNLLGESVRIITVKNLVKDEYKTFIKDLEYRICLNAICDLVYYSVPHGVNFFKDQIRVPVWFKKDAYPKYACYCSKVQEDDIVRAVKEFGLKTVRDVCIKTGAMKNPNCTANNPLGKCCHKTIQKIIDDSLKPTKKLTKKIIVRR
ncbi:MAG: (2Fe-2S)-binding protein [Calditerrivibrio sp.]|nr:(2Fe-2S)-binding protein [Calditerrivibrio sp.]MCA1980199.1 (2Fe-2S)-binding protein [Calditerrivibrio sp.]